jgi:cell division cycle protein 20 (cofactor of APC complex)
LIFLELKGGSRTPRKCTRRFEFGLLGVEDAKGAGNRIMSFQEKAPSRRRHCQQPEHSVGVGIGGGEKNPTRKLVSRSIPSVPSRILDAPDMMDDYYLNRLIG